MNISGILVHAAPARLEAVRRALELMPGVEIHTITDDGRLVVTVEDAAEVNSGDTVLAIHRIDGVLSAALVYHNFESELDEAGPQESGHDPVTT